MSISRREFLETTALAGAAPAAFGAAGKLPSRVLGKTGARVSILAFGSGSRFLMYPSEEQALAALNKALDLGITYVDTAYGYGKGKSETLVGKVMATRRKEVFLATKVNVRNGDEARRIIEGSLKRLQTDQVDLLHIHQLMDEKDLAAIEAPDGVLKVLYKAREEKLARFIGITCHADPAVLKTALERHDFDCTQMALNAARAGMVNTKSGFETKLMPEASFETLALPVANRKNMGIIAMKVFAQEKLLGKASVEHLLRYALSLPVTAAVAGMPKLEHIERNIETARNFKPLSKQEMKQLAAALAGENKLALDRFFLDHIDA